MQMQKQGARKSYAINFTEDIQETDLWGVTSV